MSDETTPPPNPIPSPVPPTIPGPIPPRGGGRPVLDQAEISAGSVMAILVYAINFVFPLFWIVPLIMRDNRFSLYHAKQGLTMFLIGVIACAILGGLTAATLGLGACISVPVMSLIGVAGFVLNIFGLVYAITGQVKPLPIIGVWGERWFGNIDVKPRGV